MRLRISPMRSRISANEAQPLPAPKVSQASQSGIADQRANRPKPPTALAGALSLKKKGENGSAENGRADGFQKLTSGSPRPRRNSYQSRSVTATVPYTNRSLAS